jgi:hypothetical protein
MFMAATCLLGGGCDDSKGVTHSDGGPRAQPTGCPAITSWAISPLVTSVGGQVSLQATAVATTDAASTINVRWGGIRGRIAAAPSAVTTFTCLTGGKQAVTLTAAAAGCESVQSFSVFCVAPKCGDGHLDPGEQCDPPNGTTCLAGCSLPCGNGLIEPGEQCDPPDGITCSATCQSL